MEKMEEEEERTQRIKTKLYNHIISHTSWFKGSQNKLVRFPRVCQSAKGAAGEIAEEAATSKQL